MKMKKLIQTGINFFLLLNTKEDILKNFGNQRVDGRRDSMEVNTDI